MHARYKDSIQTARTIVELKGGLGNQLFQFAAGLRRVRGDHNALYLNVSYFDKDSRHGGFILDRLFPEFRFQLTKARRFNTPTAYLNFDDLADFYPSEVFELDCPIYLSGYFQNIRIVKPLLPSLRELFKAVTNQVLRRYESVVRDSSHLGSHQHVFNTAANRKHVIGVHLRRGDYLKAETASVHGIPNLVSIVDILNKEIEIAGGRENIAVVVFTDSKELPYPFEGALFSPSESNNKVLGDIEEFVAMSQCDALICSNSSFSYWAGLLSGRIQRHYLPSHWMKSGSVVTGNLINDQNGIVFATELT